MSGRNGVGGIGSGVTRGATGWVAILLGIVMGAGTAVAAPRQPVYDKSFDLPMGETIAEEVAGGSEDGNNLPEEDDPTFFDEDIPAVNSIIYVIDRSGSMTMEMAAYTDGSGSTHFNVPRLAVAKMELKSSISALSPNFEFNVIFYGSCIFEWRQDKVPATDQNKQDAFGFIDGITPGGWTNTAGASGRALVDKDNRTVVLLSDGTPNFLDCAETSVVSDVEHRRIIRSLNTQGAQIHCFAIAPSPDARSFMQGVAFDSTGIYREIN